jgi:predicted Zn finger-like uncharacterized protein
MRIECDKCAAKYSIADEKVRGKTFKIRCKKCSNVIIVRDKVAGEDGGDAAEEPASSEDAGGGWHVAIDGDTVGPLPEDEVRRRYEAGQIDKSTSVWREGFEDWLELGQIEAFADLPDRPSGGMAAGGMAAGMGLAASAPADDPFASSGSDDAFSAGSGEFGRGGGGGFAAPAAAPVAAAAAARPQAAAAAAPAESPRVGASSLTGQRNENSVLFSLDSLKAMASAPAAGGGARPSHAGPVRSAPSTTAPASEGSGLIDIRAMGAMMDAQATSSVGPSSASEDELLPSFGGGALGGLSVEPLVVEPPPSAVPVATEQRRSNAPMYILIALLMCGLIGLGVMIVLDKDEAPKEVIKEIHVPGTVDEKDKTGEKDEKDENDDKDEKDDKESADAGDTGGETEGDAADTGGTAIKKKKKVGGTSGGTTGGTTTGGTTTGGTTTGGTTGKTPEKEPDVDCLLDPNLPKCKGGGSTGGSSKPAADPSLPAKLGQAEITSGLDPVKAEAKKCGAGTAVAIKFSVKGSTGSVISATPLEEHASTPIGKCVATAAKGAKFPKFQADQQGFTFKFRL